METLVPRIALALATQGRTLVTAESCTGGLIGAMLTNLPGSSAWYLGGVVSYANELKTGLLGISAETLGIHGAVSRETAQAMAVGVREKTGADFSVAVTGIAGPAGGTPEKPVGLVYIGITAPPPTEPAVFEHHFEGTRSEIRTAAASAALQHVLDAATAPP